MRGDLRLLFRGHFPRRRRAQSPEHRRQRKGARRGHGHLRCRAARPQLARLCCRPSFRPSRSRRAPLPPPAPHRSHRRSLPHRIRGLTTQPLRAVIAHGELRYFLAANPFDPLRALPYTKFSYCRVILPCLAFSRAADLETTSEYLTSFAVPEERIFAWLKPPAAVNSTWRFPRTKAPKRWSASPRNFLASRAGPVSARAKRPSR